LPAGTTALDLLIVSNGGDPTVAWRIVSLIRQRVKKFSALIPQAAYSAATLIVLGADEVVMHPNGNLGPTDPQIRVQRRTGKDGAVEAVGFGSEDLMAFLKFSRDQVGLKDPKDLLAVYSKFCDEVSTLGVGASARSALLSVTLGEKLLQLHMKGDDENKRARAISEKLTKDYFHHGYPVNKNEAKEIGLKIAAQDEVLEKLMWDIWCDLSTELKLREPHNPLTVLADNPASNALFAPAMLLQMPVNLPPALMQQAHQNVLSQLTIAQAPPAPFETIHAVFESARHVSRFVTNGLIFGTKSPDQQIRISTLNVRQLWKTIPLDAPDQPTQEPPPPIPVQVLPSAVSPPVIQSATNAQAAANVIPPKTGELRPKNAEPGRKSRKKAPIGIPIRRRK
jgi:hypothetical protein